MRNRIGLLLAAVMVLNMVPSIAYGFTNPLKSYDLYADTHPGEGSSSSMSSSSSSETGMSGADAGYGEEEGMNKSRNETLRDSSRNVYADTSTPPAWEQGPSYYQNPTLESIIEKYRKSDFAGCMQECISYVRLNPNDTLGFYYLAMSYTKVNDKDNAIRAYEKVIALNDNPMIVKYATNGRNCIMDNDTEKCYPNVNEPELIYPYADVVTADLTPVDPETLVNQNLAKLREKLSPQVVEEDEDNGKNSKDKDKKKIVLPFGNQDEELDKFINAPYGNGLSPKLNNQYKQIQLRKIQSTVNTGEDSPEKDTRDLKYIQKFDNQKSDLGTDRLAYDNSFQSWNDITKDPQYIKNKQEIDELNLLLGNDSSKDSNDIMDLLPYMTDTEKKNQNLSPEVIQAMMLKSMTSNFNL